MFIIFIIFLCLNLNNSLNVNNLIKNKNYLSQLPYNKLLNNIDNHEISKIYISNNLNSVISETNDEDFLVTEISPVITNNLVEKSTKNNIETIFLQDPSTYQFSINNILKVADTYFVPFIFLTLIIVSIIYLLLLFFIIIIFRHLFYVLNH